MLKLRIDKKTNRVLKAYPDFIEVPQPFVLISEEKHSEMSEDTENIYFYKNKKFVTVSRAEYETKEKRKAEIIKELSELDNKRIRAVCEPSIKDEETGETWLDFYNNEILALRAELSTL